MEHNTSFEKNVGRHAVATDSCMKRNIPGGLSLPLLFCIALIPLTHELNRADCGYQVHRTERQISYLLYLDDMKLLGRSEDDLENEKIILKAVSKDINMNLG
jgi:hypothetical protein